MALSAPANIIAPAAVVGGLKNNPRISFSPDRYTSIRKSADVPATEDRRALRGQEQINCKTSVRSRKPIGNDDQAGRDPPPESMAIEAAFATSVGDRNRSHGQTIWVPNKALALIKGIARPMPMIQRPHLKRYLKISCASSRTDAVSPSKAEGRSVCIAGPRACSDSNRCRASHLEK
jgi:hypothetical protein